MRRNTPRYVFLDNWVFSLLRDAEAAARLDVFVRSNGFTVLLTSLSMVELYNPGWEKGGADERGAATVRFLARVPCVIVNPVRIWEMEAAARLRPLQALPFELDLSNLSAELREETLLRFLRRDQLFLQQGHDIHAWSQNYEEAKKGWLSDVANIIENACRHGPLKRDSTGALTDLEDAKELFLWSLDLRYADPNATDEILEDALKRARAGLRPRLTSARLSSLCFWYSYVDVDKANRTRRSGSDLGDLYHISLLPYCSAFTTDGTMYRMIQRMRERVVPVSCQLMTKHLLEGHVRGYV